MAEIFRIMNSNTGEEHASGYAPEMSDLELAHLINAMFDHVRTAPWYLPQVDRIHVEICNSEQEGEEASWKC